MDRRDIRVPEKLNREFITNGFEAAGITEAIKNAQYLVNRIDNPFME